MSHSIYIADDERNIRDLIKSFLESDGYEVSAFETGDELKAAFDEKPADLVILDIMMPGTDGLTVCKQLREESGVPIIILTAKDSEYDYVHGITIGSDDYLTNGRPVRLTRTELKMLLYMMKNPQKAYSRDELLEAIWGFDTKVETRVTDETLRRIRKQLSACESNVSVKTMWGFGYRIEVNGDKK